MQYQPLGTVSWTVWILCFGDRRSATMKLMKSSIILICIQWDKLWLWIFCFSILFVVVAVVICSILFDLLIACLSVNTFVSHLKNKKRETKEKQHKKCRRIDKSILPTEQLFIGFWFVFNHCYYFNVFAAPHIINFIINFIWLVFDCCCLHSQQTDVWNEMENYENRKKQQQTIQ